MTFHAVYLNKLTKQDPCREVLLYRKNRYSFCIQSGGKRKYAAYIVVSHVCFFLQMELINAKYPTVKTVPCHVTAE